MRIEFPLEDLSSGREGLLRESFSLLLQFIRYLQLKIINMPKKHHFEVACSATLQPLARRQHFFFICALGILLSHTCEWLILHLLSDNFLYDT